MFDLNSVFPPDCFPKTDASFLVGEMHNRIAACNTMASLHIQPGRFHKTSENASFTYVSHSIKEFFSNIRKVPENFNNASAYHICVDTQINWDATDKNRSRSFDPSSDEFKPAHGSGIEDLAKEIIKNVTSSSSNHNHSLLYLGSYITNGYVGCPEARFDWEQNGQMHNLSKVAGMSGTERTKQWLDVKNTEGITKLGMVGTMSSHFVITGRDFSDQDAGATILTRYLPMQVLFALFVATLVVSCA